MADLPITPADVIASSDAQITDIVLAADTVAGEVLYRASGVATKGTARGTELQAAVTVMALGSGAAGQPIKALVSGVVDVGGGLEIGTVLVLSPTTPGKLAPPEDLDPDDYMTLVGVPISESQLHFRPFATGAQIPTPTTTTTTSG